jgi:uncharacterized protein (DUF433 family)
MPIVRDRNISFNQPILAGRRLTVFNIVYQLYLSDDLDSYLSEFEINLVDAKDAISYCVSTRCSSTFNQGDQFCDGCILSTISEGNDFDRNDYSEIKDDDTITISHSGDVIFLGSLNELEESQFGKVGWLIAEFVREKFPQLREK